MNSRDGLQRLFCCCSVLAVIALSANLASAQTNLGNISGAVNDPQGAALPDADVTATAVATGVTTKTKTNETGFYVLPNLPIGSYVLTVERSGYSRYVREGITMTTGQSIGVDVKLQIGAVAETVTVTGAASVLGTRTSDVSQLVESQSVQDIPLGDRRVLNIISLAAGALFVRYNANARANFILAGGRAQSQMFWVDGGSGVNMRIGVAQIDVDPPVDYVREVKVIANAAAAEYGGSAGGVVVVSTKSGTNQFHGTLSEFLRNDKLDAPGFFAPVVNGRKDRPSLRYNVFGGTLGGPVRRDKSFFFLGYEGSFRRTGDTETLTVPSIPQREGDFSQTFTAAGQLVPIYDPGSTVTQGARTVRTPFANNRIPANQLDPVAVKLMPFYPLPNRTPDNLAGANNVRANYVFALDRRNIMGKLDHNFSAKDRLVARYNYNNDVNRYTSVYPDPGADGRQHSVRRYQYWYGSWTRVASASLVNDLRFTYGNRMIDYSTKGQGGSYPEKLGLKGVHDDGFPQFSPAGFSSVGASQADRDQFPSEQFQFVNDVSWVHGRHFVKFGGEARRSSNVEANYGESTGFSPQGTGLPGAAASGSGLASLLTGFVTSFNQSTQPALNRNAWYLAGFVQDDWGIRKNLTLNLGLRWETDTPVVDAANRMNGFDPTAINPVSGTPGVVKFAGLNGFPSKPYRTDWNNFGPRIGFAWRPLGSSTTAVRGFFGIFFAHPFDTGVPTAASLGFNVSTSMNSPDNGITPAFFLRNGAPVSPAAPVLNDSFGSVPVGAAPRVAVTYFDPERRTGYSQQFNLGIERELPDSILISVSYIGNLSRKLPGSSLSINQIQPQLLGPDRRSQRDRPFPQFSNVSVLVPTLAISNYHGALIRFEKRYARGFNVVSNYTFSKFLANNGESADFSFGAFGPSYSNYYNRRADYGPSGNDVRHHFAFSSVYELPFGVGKSYLAKHPLRYAVGGWGIGAMITLQSGAPFTVLTQANTTNAFSAGGLRADVIRNPNLARGQRTLTRYFDTGAFQQPAPFQFGNQNPGLVRAAGIANFDFSIIRNFQISERARLQFRVEMFNIFNHTNLENPGSTFGSAPFGVVNSARDARRIQLGLRMTF